MEYPSSILESDPHYFRHLQYQNEFKTITSQNKPKTESKQELDLTDLIQQINKDFLKLNETATSNFTKILEDDELVDSNSQLNLNVDFINTSFSNNDTIGEKINETTNDTSLLGKDLVTDITNIDYNANTQLESDNTATENVSSNRLMKAVEIKPEDSEESSYLKDKLDESASYKMFEETFKTPENEKGEEFLTPGSDKIDYMNLLDSTKSGEALSVTEIYADQIPPPINYNETTTDEVISNCNSNEKQSSESQQDFIDNNEYETPDELILSQSSPPSNTDVQCNENEGDNEEIEIVLATSLPASEPVIEKSENDAEDL